MKCKECISLFTNIIYGVVKMKKNKEVKVEYYDNGNKSREIHYKDGKEDGVITTWNEDGTKRSEEHYKDGIPDGVSTYWSIDGTELLEEHYKDGELVKKVA